MIDRIVQYPHRYRAIPVAGRENVFDFVPVPGIITADGTPLNKGALLSDETARSLCLTDDETATINTALRRINLSSFMTFCGADLDAALGKGNESRLFGIGRQLAMYAWFMGESATFSTLIKCDTLQECYQHAIAEILSSPAVTALLNGSTYASENMYTEDNIRAWRSRYEVMSKLVGYAASVDVIRSRFWTVWKENWMTYINQGDVVFVVPQGVTCLTTEVIGAGGDPLSPYSGGRGGGYQLYVANVAPNQVINGSISSSGTTFGDVVLGKGEGVGLEVGVAGNGPTPQQSGKFAAVSGGGKAHIPGSGNPSGAGGGGGYGGGDGGKGSATISSHGKQEPLGGIGSKVVGAGGGGTGGTSGGGGGGYGGGAGHATGKGGSGCIVIYM